MAESCPPGGTVVFASLVFLFLFLPLQFAAYFARPGLGWRNGVLLVFSLLFYAWGEPRWVLLLLGSCLLDHRMALVIERYRGTRRAKLALGTSLVSNLGLLAAFKYSGLAVETVNQLAGTQLPVPAPTLPVGISFYTFQALSYVVDVYRGEVPAERSYARLLLYVSLFHQLVAGPIVRYVDVARDLAGRRFHADDFSRGVTRLCVGLFKKACIANVAGELVARYLDGPLSGVSTDEAWFGLAMYTLQIYFDFSGYSDMAIGMGLMAGFHYLENFDHPYVARSVGDFWRRWHISLGTFFRDYVYFPLGGRRHHALRNLFVVWFLTGLWHGASWNFVLWGLFHGSFVTAERVAGLSPERWPRLLAHLYVLPVVMVGWALFYFTDLTRLGQFLATLAGYAPEGATSEGLAAVLWEHALWLVLAVVLCLPVRSALEAWVAARQQAWVR
ncbi:MAG: MBOAT family protein, partial [Deltaproteobacteria bacterium]|nr:MBOAT family protein [Deltaproteobacteria bacterium]